MKMYEIDDKVRVLPYKTLKDTCTGIDEDGDLCFGDEYFVEEMNEYCTRTGKIVDILTGVEKSDITYIIAFDDEDEVCEFYFNERMIERIGCNDTYNPTVVFDFDGVIHSYKSGWKGNSVCVDPPVDGIKDVIDKLHDEGYLVVVQSSRCATRLGREAVQKYLDINDIYVDNITAEKPAAVAYVDDRAICFTGNTKNLINRIKKFKPWYEKEKDE